MGKKTNKQKAIRIALKEIIKTFVQIEENDSKSMARHARRSRKLINCTKYRPNKTKIIFFEFKIQ